MLRSACEGEDWVSGNENGLKCAAELVDVGIRGGIYFKTYLERRN